MSSSATPGSSPMKLPMAAIGVLVLVSLVSTAAVRLSGISISEPDAAAVVTRSFRFDDKADGTVDVFDAASGRLVHTVRGQAGFIRGALRGLARERRRAGIGATPPFDLIGRADGRLTLLDPSTGRRIDLESFGPTNAADFAQLLVDTPTAPATSAGHATPATPVTPATLARRSTP